MAAADPGQIFAHKGCIFFSSPTLQNAAEAAWSQLENGALTVDWTEQWTENRSNRDGPSVHVTLATARELRWVSGGLDAALVSAQELLSTRYLELGIGYAQQGGAQCAFLVLCWPAASLWRRSLGLSWKDLHCTLGFLGHDVHDKPKGVASIGGRATKVPGEQGFRAVVASMESRIESVEGLEDLARLVDMLEMVADASGHRPWRVKVLRLRSKLLARQGRYEELVACADEMVDLSMGNNAECLAIRALVLVKLRRFAEAIDDVDAALVKMPKTAVDRRVQLLRTARQCRCELGLPPGLGNFFKFPRTPHLLNTGGDSVTRDDLLLDAEATKQFLGSSCTVYVEEKIDGANMGISVSTSGEVIFQNRSHYVTCHSQAQFSKLPMWADEYGEALRGILEPERHILFGEWCAVAHSLQYTRLPGYFIAFDIYDRYAERFFTREEFHTVLRPTAIPVVPLLAKKALLSREEVLDIVNTPSLFREGCKEGVYLRCETESGIKRCKVVRSDFVQGIKFHWTSSMQTKNVVDQEFKLTYDGYSEAPGARVTPEEQLQTEQKVQEEVPCEPEIAKDFGTDPSCIYIVKLTNSETVDMQRNFSFIFPNQVAISSIPKREAQISALRELGFTLVVTLTEERSLRQEWFGTRGTRTIENLYVPVEDFHPPSTEQVDLIISRVTEEVRRGGKVLVHCAAGKGRAGTVAACFILRFGVSGINESSLRRYGTAMPSNDAIRTLRSMRPHSMETNRQEEFLREYAEHIWRTVSSYPDENLVPEKRRHPCPRRSWNWEPGRSHHGG